MAKSDITRVMVVVRDEDDGEIVLDKAHRLARAAGASLLAISIVHEDFADLSFHDEKTRNEIRQFLCHSVEARLAKLTAPMMGQGVEIETRCIWNKYEWRGILEMAEDADADFIIKGTDFPVREVVRTPSDWNLLRHADIPVMLVKPINWVESPVILAAIDATEEDDFELNKRVLDRAAVIARALSGSMHVISVYPSVEHWVGPITLAINFDVVRDQAHREISNKISKMLGDLGLEPAQVHTREGHTEQEIQRAVEDTGAEIMVMGTHRRSGAEGIILGNTSEKILSTVRSDVEVIR